MLCSSIKCHDELHVELDEIIELLEMCELKIDKGKNQNDTLKGVSDTHWSSQFYFISFIV